MFGEPGSDAVGDRVDEKLVGLVPCRRWGPARGELGAKHDAEVGRILDREGDVADADGREPLVRPRPHLGPRALHLVAEEREALVGDRGSALAGWVHYLAFDLFIGSWQVRDAVRNAIPLWLVLPCLVLTFLFGPIGLVAYLAVRTARTRRLGVAE